MRAKWVRGILAVAISLGAAILAANQVDWSRLKVALSQVDVLWLAIAIAFLALSMGAKVVRWRILLVGEKRFGVALLARALLMGYLLNTVLPGRVGELARAGLVARRGQAELGLVISSIVVEKILDILTLLVFAGAFSLVVPLPTWLARASQISGLVAVLSCAVIVVAASARHRLRTLVDRFALSRFRSPARFLRIAWDRGLWPFLEGVSWYNQPRVVVAVAWWSGIVWLTGAAVNYSLLSAFAITPTAPAAVATLVATNIGMAVPSAPGYTGVFHYLSVLALQPFSVEREVALGYAVVAHLTIFGSFVLAGVAAAWQELSVFAWLRLSLGGTHRRRETPLKTQSWRE